MQSEKTVLITGSASGIGRASAMRFAMAGWRCVLVDHQAEALQSLLETMPQAGEPHLIRVVNLMEPAEIAALAADMPHLDALINNAGMSDSTQLPLTAMTQEQFAPLVRLNLDAPRLMFRTLATRLKPHARVVNVASGAGLQSIPLRGVYSPTKAGVIAFTKALAVARPDLGVTALCPGFVRTEIVRRLIESGRLDPVRAAGKTPLGRIAEPAELAEALFFLASEGARPLSGSALSVDGAASAYGGSAPCAPAEYDVLPLDTDTAIEVTGTTRDATQDWIALQTSNRNAGYSAVIDASVLNAPDGQRLNAAHEAATRFARWHTHSASLTLLLPTQPTDWRTCGDDAATRMFVATQACEWGSKGLRINSLEVHAHTPVDDVRPITRYMAGAASQFLTGQSWTLAR
ncbi:MULTISPECIES: SDR family NAD(P)-dependent oxidoreductase [unclassified Burkholderia]|uniref:SDR family NAD(P)-dependent oxidoreductase n=1 Tax=unclassified Burkholderia TaxID=2613784 RepID=UPI000F5A6DBD|nr:MULTISPECIES: SDR family oxidoreductase [unclassified Burkholderia]RQR31553.1 SDR family NAD(P)-dependent oxidoreductase [Burkholderia sp. Bp9131]RQR70746.1 SDR family NAD(P)-dependent oxidoreductase [Burkholderia sp. Bp9015]RQS02272.1 SDR family NAD(P)-dependent oxidoreductase [Burkholderia sp. Bp8991]